jgi:hypothetical protein
MKQKRDTIGQWQFFKNQAQLDFSGIVRAAV